MDEYKVYDAVVAKNAFWANVAYDELTAFKTYEAVAAYEALKAFEANELEIAFKTYEALATDIEDVWLLRTKLDVWAFVTKELVALFKT